MVLTRLTALTLLAITAVTTSDQIAPLLTSAIEACENAQLAIDADATEDAKGLIDGAIADLEQASALLDGDSEPDPTPDPDPDPEPDPGDVVSLPTTDAPWWLLLDKVQPQSNSARYQILDQDNVDGLSIRVRWSAIQPARNRFDFDLIDKLAGEAKKRGKVWTLRVMAGTNSPKWLDCPTYSDGDGTFPIPWCPELTAEFGRLMLALGQEYRDDPDLVMVHVPGFDESAEMHMPKGRNWPTNEMADAWEQRIDLTSAAFPRQLICLNHSPENWSDAVRQWHQRLGKSRACFQMNALKASTSTTWKGYTILDQLDNGGWPIGFQFVGPSTNRTRFGGTFQQAVNKGEDAGSRWYEFYQPDAGDIP